MARRVLMRGTPWSVGGGEFQYLKRKETSCCAFLPAGATVFDVVKDVLGRGVGLGAVAAENLECHCAAGHVEPLAAAVLVPPAFKVNAFGVFAHEEVAFEFVIRGAGAKAFQVRFAVGVEFGFLGSDAAVRAVDC